MRRVIYSLYIDIPKEDLDYQTPYSGDDIPKTERTKLEFIKYYQQLIECKQRYANDIGVSFVMFEYDDQFKQYKEWWNDNYPQITEYNIVNFYKIYLLEKLSKEYDEILYLDFDVIPVSSDNFFEQFNLSDGIAIANNNNYAKRESSLLWNRNPESIRSPTAKYWNCFALLSNNGIDGVNDVFNTGIIGASSKHIQQMDYFSDIDNIISQMDELIEDELYPEVMRQMFGWDNETIWSFLVKKKEIPIQWLTRGWHVFYDKYRYVPPDSKLVHVINKQFKEVLEYYEENYI
jgi:hypothetical protein